MKGLLVTTPVRRVAAALILGAALVTAGCGTTEAGRAATVDGKVITETDVQTARTQINTTFPAANLTTSQVLGRLIAAPVILSIAERQGTPVSESIAQTTYTTQPDYNGEKPEAPTLEVLRAELALQQFQQSQTQVPVSEFQKLKVVVNPRYGRFDPASASVTEQTPDWIKPAAAKQ